MLEPRPAEGDGLRNQPTEDGAAFGPEEPLLAEPMPLRHVADDEPPNAPIADQDVGAEPENEVGYARGAGREHRICEIVGRRGIVEEVGGTSDTERGVGG